MGEMTPNTAITNLRVYASLFAKEKWPCADDFSEYADVFESMAKEYEALRRLAMGENPEFSMSIDGKPTTAGYEFLNQLECFAFPLPKDVVQALPKDCGDLPVVYGDPEKFPVRCLKRNTIDFRDCNIIGDEVFVNGERFVRAEG